MPQFAVGDKGWLDVDKMREFLFSLAWSPWSCNHSCNSLRLITEICPDIDAEFELKKFVEIIFAPPGPGSPK